MKKKGKHPDWQGPLHRIGENARKKQKLSISFKVLVTREGQSWIAENRRSKKRKEASQSVKKKGIAKNAP